MNRRLNWSQTPPSLEDYAAGSIEDPSFLGPQVAPAVENDNKEKSKEKPNGSKGAKIKTPSPPPPKAEEASPPTSGGHLGEKAFWRTCNTALASKQVLIQHHSPPSHEFNHSNYSALCRGDRQNEDDDDSDGDSETLDGDTDRMEEANAKLRKKAGLPEIVLDTLPSGQALKIMSLN